MKKIKALGTTPTKNIFPTLLSGRKLKETLKKKWQFLHGKDEFFNMTQCKLKKKVLPIELDTYYSLIKFSNVSWHKDTHDDNMIYVLHILHGEATLHCGKSKAHRETIKLVPGQSYAFNQIFYHKTTGDNNNPCVALLGSFTKQTGSALLNGKLPYKSK